MTGAVERVSATPIKRIGAERRRRRRGCEKRVAACVGGGGLTPTG